MNLGTWTTFEEMLVTVQDVYSHDDGKKRREKEDEEEKNCNFCFPNCDPRQFFLCTRLIVHLLTYYLVHVVGLVR